VVSQDVQRRFVVVDLAQLPAVACPCGTARRALAEIEDFPGTVHYTEITQDARLHYHKRLMETYYILDCKPDAQMQLDDEVIGIRPGMCILIKPGVRHRAIGRMSVLILVLPKFDPDDEWFD
jgi:mannose-6-phosphate isomerase-like protein (cupin superfamily)